MKEEQQDDFFMPRIIPETLRDATALGLYTYLILEKIDSIPFPSLTARHFPETSANEIGRAIRVLMDCNLVTYCQEEHFITVLDGSEYKAPNRN